MNTADHVRANYPNCGFAIMGDFNKLFNLFTVNISDILLHHDFKEVVESPARDTALLDLIITDFGNAYSKPGITAPLGPNDHNVVTWNPVAVLDRHCTGNPIENNLRDLLWMRLEDGLVTIGLDRFD